MRGRVCLSVQNRWISAHGFISSKHLSACKPSLDVTSRQKRGFKKCKLLIKIKIHEALRPSRRRFLLLLLSTRWLWSSKEHFRQKRESTEERFFFSPTLKKTVAAPVFFLCLCRTAAPVPTRTSPASCWATPRIDREALNGGFQSVHLHPVTAALKCNMKTSITSTENQFPFQACCRHIGSLSAHHTSSVNLQAFIMNLTPLSSCRRFNWMWGDKCSFLLVGKKKLKTKRIFLESKTWFQTQTPQNDF